MKIKRLICVLLAVLMVVSLAACGGHVNTEPAKNANTITPAQSPYTWSTTPKAYVYDTTNGVWNQHRKTADGGTIPIASYQRTELNAWGTQCVDYLPASMDRPMFYSKLYNDGNSAYIDGCTDAVVARYLTGHDVFTSGNIGTAESTGIVDLSTTNAPNSGKFTWTLKDGVLFISGDTGMLNYWSCPGNSPWCDNPYIRTIVVKDSDGSTEFTATDLFYNCPNLETLIIIDGSGQICHDDFTFTNYVNTDGNPQALPYKNFPENTRVIRMMNGIATFADVDYGIQQTRNGTDKHTEVQTYAFGKYADLMTKTAYSTRADYDKLRATNGLTWNAWSDATIKQLIESAYLTQDAANMVNAFFAEHNIGITVTADSTGSNPVDPTPAPQPTPKPTPQPTPAPTGYDPEETAGGTATNPVCSNWAKNDVITAWNLFSDRLPMTYTGVQSGANIIQKDLKQPITRAEFATLAVAAYDYILGDTLENNGTNWTLHSISMSVPVSKMTDILDNYYASGIICSINMGLMNGYSETSFGADDHLTREQAATVLGRIADRYSTFPYRANPSQSAEFPAWTGANPYTDTISNWALDGVLRARAAGIMIGTSDTAFSAKADFTKEQALVTLLRMVNWCKPWYQELSQTLLDDDPVHDAANPFLHSR